MTRNIVTEFTKTYSGGSITELFLALAKDLRTIKVKTMEQNIEFNVAQETRDSLKELINENEFCAFGQNAAGEVFPIAIIQKHPECPDGWFELFEQVVKGM